MFPRTILIVYIVTSFSVFALADGKKENKSKFEDSLNQVVQVFQNADCDHNFTAADTEQNLADACKEAHETPEIAAVRGNFSCSFDLENYVIFAKTAVVGPEFHIAPNGEVKQIVKGNLAVTAKDCKKIAKATTSHAATDDLCFSYFPDKSFAEYQEKAQCSETRAPASKVTAPPTSNTPTTNDDEDSDTDVAGEAQRDLSAYDSAVRS